mmetsp:Transcript_19796/g.32068  ORF Transcript_19796/g.32068 Transcript_19796/m.32068 type:complete len:220 (-) Transcript_19796:703-1362(-)
MASSFMYISPIASSCSPSLPLHSWNSGIWMAADHEKDRFQGSLAVLCLLMASRRAAASSSDWPPLRKLAVTIAVGKQRRNTWRFAMAISSTVYDVGQSFPGLTMLDLRIAPSIYTPWSSIALNSSDCSLTLMRTAVSRSWSPLREISGSTMGTSPSAWHMRAYLARSLMLASMTRSEGCPAETSISMGDRHLANSQPAALYSMHRAARESSPCMTVAPD